MSEPTKKPMREFEIIDPSVTGNMVTKYITVREVDPAYDAMVTKMAEALENMLGARYWIEATTVPNAGINAAPEQVVYNASIGYLRVESAREALALYREWVGK